MLIVCRWWQEYLQLVYSGAGLLIALLFLLFLKTLMKKQQRASPKEVKIFALEIFKTSAHLLRVFPCMFALYIFVNELYFFATSFTHLLFISVVKFLHSCIRASGPDPFYAGYKHNIYDTKFSVNKCYMTGQKMRETFLYLLVNFYVFSQFRCHI